MGWSSRVISNKQQPKSAIHSITLLYHSTNKLLPNSCVSHSWTSVEPSCSWWCWRTSSGLPRSLLEYHGSFCGWKLNVNLSTRGSYVSIAGFIEQAVMYIWGPICKYVCGSRHTAHQHDQSGACWSTHGFCHTDTADGLSWMLTLPQIDATCWLVTEATRMGSWHYEFV